MGSSGKSKVLSRLHLYAMQKEEDLFQSLAGCFEHQEHSPKKVSATKLVVVVLSICGKIHGFQTILVSNQILRMRTWF